MPNRHSPLDSIAENTYYNGKEKHFLGYCHLWLFSPKTPINRSLLNSNSAAPFCRGSISEIGLYLFNSKMIFIIILNIFSIFHCIYWRFSYDASVTFKYNTWKKTLNTCLFYLCFSTLLVSYWAQRETSDGSFNIICLRSENRRTDTRYTTNISQLKS